MKSYGTWGICIDEKEENGVAFRQMPDGGQLFVLLKRSNPYREQYEGWWPKRPSKRKKPIVIAGIYLWDWRWRVKFKPPHLANMLSPALPSERTTIYTHLAQGHKIERMWIPAGPGEYHLLLLDWQIMKIEEMMPEGVLYHLPVEECHVRIRKLEQLLGTEIPQLHAELDNFAEKIREIIEKSLSGRVVVEFIQPLKMGAKSPKESFVWPYLYPEIFGADPSNVFGVEDLMKVRYVYEAWRKTGRITPVLCGVIGIPHPFMYKSLLVSKEEVKEIVL